MTAVTFALAAAIGAVGRELMNRTGLGWRGTLTVNVVGAFALGVVLARHDGSAVTVIGVGLLGSFTTYSTFALEVSDARAVDRLVIIGATVVLGVAAAFLGAAIR